MKYEDSAVMQWLKSSDSSDHQFLIDMKQGKVDCMDAIKEFGIYKIIAGKRRNKTIQS